MSFAPFAVASVRDSLHRLKSSSRGLTDAEAQKRRKANGPNEITKHEVLWYHLLARQFRSSFVYLLLTAAAASFLLGDRVESILVLTFILVNTLLGFVQEFRSERALKLLRRLIRSTARVKRNGRVMEIPTSDVVTGDLVLLETGDRVPADLRLTEIRDAAFDESPLTGESEPVRKQTTALHGDAAHLRAALYRANNIAFSGTTMINGGAAGVAIATGNDMELGSIAELAAETKRPSVFEKNLMEYGRFILRLVVVTLALIFFANLAIKGRHADTLQLFLFFIALTVSVIPEALPVITSVSLSRGALALAKSRVVVKRLSAIEDLGSIEVLCADKTGTLTQDALAVSAVYGNREHACLRAAARLHEGGPFDAALAAHLSKDERDELASSSVIARIPFDPHRRRASALMETRGKKELVMRGAPENVIAATGHPLDDGMRRFLRDQGLRGRRVLAVASKEIDADVATYRKDDEIGLEFLGMIAFADPIKPTAKAAIRQAKRLGVRVKILTGDAPEVAGAVAKEVGLIEDPADVVTGDDWEAMDEEARRAAAESHAVFARVSPEQKYAIIKHLQSAHEVGFLGEGINDAPALKIANVGLAVDNASDLARDAADIVLLEPSLHVIMNGIEQGRKIFANIVKYIRIALSSNFGNFYSIAFVSLLIPFLPMLPIQILLENLLSDFPMIAIAGDAVDAAELKRPKTMGVRNLVLFATVLGLVSSVFDMLFFGFFFHAPAGVLQTNWFLLSLLTELVLIFSARTRFFALRTKRISFALIVLALAVTTISLALPFSAIGHTLFHFVTPSPQALVIVLTLVTAYAIATEFTKLAYQKIRAT